jgi:hypothetical protein
LIVLACIAKYCVLNFVVPEIFANVQVLFCLAKEPIAIHHYTAK